ncbi:hypothetical protein BCR37DRAFT_387251 [Protomyces lactucae-debilis]|uniref:SUEL-type lectin domain-containing protein n=1 Tax=Protomyces lactucae-debilis TaxID=2754530 RepID=A0A1Y2FF65_PROLT|nr:uncharacterized protein BCR37DRAFT_387251 [Protomyces lactucae-debilis]ORY82552.1 hypothetical protein BCR37DRAFT_387251 [Protomyces lactucae-debilis]
MQLVDCALWLMWATYLSPVRASAVFQGLVQDCTGYQKERSNVYVAPLCSGKGKKCAIKVNLANDCGMGGVSCYEAGSISLPNGGSVQCQSRNRVVCQYADDVHTIACAERLYYNLELTESALTLQVATHRSHSA